MVAEDVTVTELDGLFMSALYPAFIMAFSVEDENSYIYIYDVYLWEGENFM